MGAPRPIGGRTGVAISPVDCFGVLFHDAHGIRIESNHAPRKEHLADPRSACH